MRLLRVGPAGHESPVVCTATGDYFDASSITPDYTPEFFAAGGKDAVRAAVAEGALPGIEPPTGRIGAPLARAGAILCIGRNYVEHAREGGSAPPASPILFYKAPNTLVGPNDPVHLPRGSRRLDWEVELGIVIGARARYLAAPGDADACVAGLVLSNDVSERDFQLEQSGGQWSKGKSCETFNPLGPWLRLVDDLDELGAVTLRSWVNGQPRQSASCADMIFDCRFLVWHLSQYTVLEPGDIINTGTPAGVALGGAFPYLVEGDVLETEIDSLGRQRNQIIAAP